jgi:iron(III) transport system ATP-binding protein
VTAVAGVPDLPGGLGGLRGAQPLHGGSICRVWAGDLADGTAVDVLIRPEGLRLLRDGGAAPCRFRVQRIRDLGTNRVLELELPDGPPLIVRLTSITEFVAGDVVAVEVDPRQVYVYRAPPLR